MELLLKGGRVIDPLNEVDDKLDLALEEGEVVSVKEDIEAGKAEKYLDVSGKVILPGIIDTHAHFSRQQEAIGHPMMASAGVTTAIDFAATPNDLAGGLKRQGVGLNVGCLFPLVPGETISGKDPKRSELKRVISEARENGALGIKLIGGHHPITPEAFRKAVEITNQEHLYIATHLGTTESASNITGLQELWDLLGDNHIHIAHVNSYCRGMIEPVLEEVKEALEIIKNLGDKVVSESYLGTINGTDGACKQGLPKSHVTRNCLTMEDYEESKEGLKEAIMDGYCSVVYRKGSERVLITGKEGVDRWLENKTNVRVSFPVNSPKATFLLATAMEEDNFIIDAISSDGGSYPRNHIVDRGLALVRYGALSLSEFAQKTSAAPARMFGLKGKGHLGKGADADLTVLDLDRGEAVMSITRGKLTMVNGIPIGTGGALLATASGCQKMNDYGFSVQEATIEQSSLYR